MPDIQSQPNPPVNRAQVRFAFSATIISMVAGALIGVLIALRLAGPIESTGDLPRWTILLSEAFIPLPLLWLLRRRGLPLVQTLRLRPVAPVVMRDALIIALGVTVLIDELDRLVALLFPLPSNVQQGMSFLQFNTPFEALLIIAGAAVVAPIAEEVVFRGFFQGQLEQGLNDATRAVLYSAGLFMILHFNPWWAIQIYTLGMILGYLVWRTGSVWPAVLLHGVNNLAAIMFANGNDESFAWYTLGGHVSPLWLLVAAIMTYAGLRSLAAGADQDKQQPGEISHA